MSPRNNVVPLASRSKRRLIPREELYIPERLNRAMGCIIPNLRVSTTTMTPGGEKDVLHFCKTSRGHFTDVLITGYDKDGLAGRCRTCGKVIEDLMGKLRPEWREFFRGKSANRPVWIDERPA